MGKWRSKRKRLEDLVAWQRRLNRRCPVKALYDQYPLPTPKVGDYLLTWDTSPVPKNWVMPPPQLPLDPCGCHGYHIPIRFFWRVEQVGETWVDVSRADYSAHKSRVYLSQVIFNLGQYPPNHKNQTFEHLTGAQRKLIMRLFFRR